jgi:hypothetical protein
MFQFLQEKVSGTGLVYGKNGVKRLELRARFIIDRNIEDIAGSRVLDLASHDGRWPYAFAKAGAASVIGVEGRQDLVDLFAGFPDDEYKKKVDLRAGDMFDALEAFVAAGETFDVVGILGVFYHIMDHYRLLRLAAKLKPKLMIVDSEFALQPWPMIQIGQERTDKYMNSTAYFPGQLKAPIGRPSRSAMRLMAESLGYSTRWLDWSTVPQGRRRPVYDYFLTKDYRRLTCTLRPLPQQA